MTAMTCEKFKVILPEYFEGELPDEAKLEAETHANSCASCGRIVADIGGITTEAAALPPLAPARDLWAGIQGRISAPVIPLSTPVHRTARHSGTRWMAAAAAALIVTTAGVTYLATSHGSPAKPPRVATVSAKPAAPTVESSVTPLPTVALAPVETPAVTASPRAQMPSATLASGGSRKSITRAMNGTAVTGPGQAEAAYTREIDILERMVNSPASGLDPATVQVVKHNLQVIDDAIAQSKAALAKDPASALLLNQVTRSMGKKIELLRTAAALSSST